MPIKAYEQTWLDTKKKVKHIKNRKVGAWIAFNEEPAAICVNISGPDDRGICKDIIINLEDVLKEFDKSRF